MKRLLIASLMVLTSLSYTQKSHATAGALVGLVTGNPTVAYLGLGIVAGSTIPFVNCKVDYCYDGLPWLLLGILVLDEDGVSNVELDISNVAGLVELGLNEKEATRLMENKEELELIFSEVSSNLDKDSTVEESKILWEEYSQFVDQSTFNTFKKYLRKKAK